MFLRISTILCCAVLLGFAAAQEHDLSFSDIEGSGNGGEVSHDLVFSGSGFGPDDEDTPRELDVGTDSGTRTKVVPPRKGTPKPAIDEPKEILTTSSTEDPSPDVRMNPKSEDRHTPFFAQPGILAAVIGGAVVGLLCAILVVMFIVYRMRKKDEGSYALGEPKQSPTPTTYSRGNNKEFYA